MILKLLVLVTTSHVIRSVSLLTKSTSIPNLPRDLQELLDSLYMTGYIPEYILPEDELTETEKTEGEYLDFPELKNAQDNVFVPPESEYSKNNLHYKNIKARKRLISDRHEKTKLSGLRKEIIQPEISPEELRSDLMARLVENLTRREQKKNDSIKLDFLIPIPERGIYPYNNSPNEGSSSTECYSLAERYDTNESNSPIEQSGSRRTKLTTLRQSYTSRSSQYGRSTQNEIGNSESTTCYDLATYDPCTSTIPDKSRQTELNNTELPRRTELNNTELPRRTELNNTESTTCYDLATYDPCTSTIPDNLRQTELNAQNLNNTEPTITYNLATYNICAPAIPNNSRKNELYNSETTTNYNLTTYDICASTNTSGDSRPTDPCNTEPIELMNYLRITQKWDTKNPNQQGPMKSFDPQKMLKILNPPLNTSYPQLLHEIPNPQWPMNTPYSQGPMNILNTKGPMNTPNPQRPMNTPNPQGPMNTPNIKGLMNTTNPQGLMKIFMPPLNILSPPQWFMNLSTNRKNFSKESTQSTISNQYSFTASEQAHIPKHPGFKQNTTIQPLTFEIIRPKSEKSIKRFQFTMALRSQPNVTIKSTLEQQIKSMLNIQKQSSPQLIVNKKQQENRLRAPGMEIHNKKHPASRSLGSSTKRITHKLEHQTISTKLDNSSIRVDLKTIDKNIATNVVSLMSDPTNINKMEAEVVKTGKISSNSVNNEITRNFKIYYDKQSNNLSEIIKQSSQNNRNKDIEKYVSQSFISPSTERENPDSGKPKKKMFTFLNIFKKNKKYPPSDVTGQNSTTQVKREIIEKSSDELYRLLMEGNSINDDDNCEYPIEQEVEEQEMFNHKRKKK